VEFQRIKRLPPYVFSIIDSLKMEARHRGEDIVDFGMGNPDLATPPHIVAKLVEAAGKPQNHRYSVSRGIYKLRVAISDWYKRRYQVNIDPDAEAIVTIGAKEGLSHLAWATVDPGDVVLCPSPTYPIHQYAVVLAGGDMRCIPLTTSEVSSAISKPRSRRPGRSPRCSLSVFRITRPQKWWSSISSSA
jgi:alanine-synthesizing transaminase